MNPYVLRLCFFVFTAVLISCTASMTDYEKTEKHALIEPDYSGLVIPPNIAPLNFRINEKADRYLVKIHPEGSPGESYYSRRNKIVFREKKWKQILEKCSGKRLCFEIYARDNGRWIRFMDVINVVADEEIDDYLVYRLIEPGFKSWKRMGIYQRSLESFEERPVFTNSLSSGNCMNCHSFCQNNSDRMLFHMRGRIGGTVILENGELNWINTRTDSTVSAGVYPQWHPQGNFVAFSVNQIIQKFHAVSDKKIEVIDTASNLVIYDVKENRIFTGKNISSPVRYETFPCWSPDGRLLYFCSAVAFRPEKFNEIKYDLLRVSFDPENKILGNIDTVISSAKTGLSVSFPRISPDGKYLLFTMSNYGNFSIWHSESDLYLLDLGTGVVSKPEINSSSAESYHSWSSNGRWIIFSSRRDDGLFTRPYISYFDSTGKSYKPFVLPQKDPRFYDTFLRSYNIPEFVRTPVVLNKRELYRLIRTKPLNAIYRSTEF